jgi:hypothetical protein
MSYLHDSVQFRHGDLINHFQVFKLLNFLFYLKEAVLILLIEELDLDLDPDLNWDYESSGN